MAALLAQAEAALQAITAQRAGIAAERDTAMEAQIQAQRAGTDAGTIEWHWNWINRLAATWMRLGREVEVRRLAVAEAERVWRAARRRRLVLERMRDLALQRHQKAQHRQEVKTIDELARLRFVLPDAGLGRDNRDD